MDESNENQKVFSRDNHSVFIPIAERFVDLVDALLMYVGAPREEMSATSIDHLVTLCDYLADPSIPLPRNRKQRSRSNSLDTSKDDSNKPSSTDSDQEDELELWWPILLGLSRAIGDNRPNIRIKALTTLFAVINNHFFTSPGRELKSTEEITENLSSPQHGDLQTLQLLFRGVLTPYLEHAEVNSIESKTSQLPLRKVFI